MIDREKKGKQFAYLELLILAGTMAAGVAFLIWSLFA